MSQSTTEIIVLRVRWVQVPVQVCMDQIKYSNIVPVRASSIDLMTMMARLAYKNDHSSNGSRAFH